MEKNLIMSLQLMGYGMAGVFITLLLFIIMIILLVKVFPAKIENNEDGSKK